ncbi:MAG: hypothetical protein WC810_22805 [Janthinobacterium sp.]
MKIKKAYEIHTLNTLSYNPNAMRSESNNSTHIVKGCDDAYEPYAVQVSQIDDISIAQLYSLPVKPKDNANQAEAPPKVPLEFDCPLVRCRDCISATTTCIVHDTMLDWQDRERRCACFEG